MIQSKLYSDIQRIFGNEIFVIKLMLNEAFENSTGTQMSNMGLYKKFALNLTTVALPNLISHDLVIVQPMSSMSGY